MNPSPTLPRFISFFIVFGIFGALFVATLPLLIATSFERETVRYDQCQKHLRYDCEPSVIWALRGLVDVAPVMKINTTTTVMTTSTDSLTQTSSTVMGTDALQLFASSSTASSTPLLLKLQSTDLVRNGSSYRAKPGSEVKMLLETQETKSVSIQVGTSTAKIVTLKPSSKGVFQGSIKLPKTLPVVLEVILKNGDDVWTGYHLSVASNQ